MDASLFTLARLSGAHFAPSVAPSSRYYLLLFSAPAAFSLDLTDYTADGATAVCFSPWQHFCWHGDPDTPIEAVAFHGDFYCIEYHKKEVACNGLLFNNIYLFPHIALTAADYAELRHLFGSMEAVSTSQGPFTDSVLKAYLQLMLALCSRTKEGQLRQYEAQSPDINAEMAAIQQLVDTHFIAQRAPSFYASELALTAGAFARKTRRYFGKTPQQLIQDRVVLEAKKLLHLTYKSVKEIAAALNFDDEFYFSRYFKRCVGTSPSHYRERTGISIAAK